MTTTKTCPHCAEEIQDQAKVCKHCGRDVRTRMSVGQIAGAGLILLVAFLIVASVVGSW